MMNVAGSGTGTAWGVVTEPPLEFVAGSFRLGVLVEVVQKPPDVVSMTVEVDDDDEPDEPVVDSVDCVSLFVIDPVDVVSEPLVVVP
jgi:hypothetical protein